MAENVPTYFPYVGDIDERLRAGSLVHIVEAVAYPVEGEPIPLDIESGSVTYDESWSPYVQADFTAKAPADQATLDRLDPRRNCRVTLSLGYMLDGIRLDVHDAADLHLRTRETLRPSNTMRLTASSDEARAQDRKKMKATPAPPRTGVNEVVQWAANLAVAPSTALVVSDFPPGYGADLLTTLDFRDGQDFGRLLQDVANRTGTWIRCDADRRWRITARSTVTGVSAHKLLVGPSGTIITSDTALQREDYFNAVQLAYVWDDVNGDEQRIYGEAWVPGTGRHGIGAIGWNVYTEERTGPISQTQADAAARNVLAYTITRGRGIRMDALSAYWVRPGMTVTIDLPAGEQERHLVRNVSHAFPGGRMSITTRQPENIVSTTGG